MQKKQTQYFLQGNGYDTWEVSVRRKGRMETIKSFSVNQQIKEISESKLSDTVKMCRKTIAYLEAKSAGEKFITQLEANV